MKEQQPQQPSLEQLQERENRLSRMIGQRRSIFENAGKGNVKIDDAPVKKAVQIGRIKAKVDNWLGGARAELSEVQEKISVLETEQVQKLTDDAQKYLDQALSTRVLLGELRAYVSQGYLSQEVLDRHEEDYRNFMSRQETEPLLARGLELLEKQKQKEAEEPKEAPLAKVAQIVTPTEISLEIQEAQADIEAIAQLAERGYIERFRLDRAKQELENLKIGIISQLPAVETTSQVGPAEEAAPAEEKALTKVTIDLSDKTVEIDGRIVRFQDYKGENHSWKFLLILAQNTNQDLTTHKLNDLASQAGSTSENVGRHYFRGLALKLEENPHNRKMLTRIGVGNSYIYQFNAQVEFVPVPQAISSQVEPAGSEPQTSSQVQDEVEVKLHAETESKGGHKLIIDRETQEVLIESQGEIRTTKLNNTELQILTRLAQKPGISVSSTELENLAKEAGRRGQKAASEIIYRLRNKLGASVYWKLIESRPAETPKSVNYVLNAEV